MTAAREAIHRTTDRYTGTLADPPLLGGPGTVATALRPYVAAGVDEVTIGFYAPFDLETVARLGELREALA